MHPVFNVRRWLALLAAALITSAASAAPGDLDSSFGAGFGKVLTAVGSADDAAAAIALQPDGKIVVGGTCYASAAPFQQFCLVRFLANGAIDTTFGNAGKVFRSPASSSASMGGLALQPDGRIVVAGSCYFPEGSHFCAARFMADGSPDASFDDDGLASHPYNPGVSINVAQVVLLPDGRMILVASCGSGGTILFCMTRLTANGAVDGTFINGGFLSTMILGLDYAADAALQPDGKLLVAGRCHSGGLTPYQFCVVRHLPGGQLDTSFSGDGMMTAAVGNGLGDDAVGSLLLQLDGKIVVGGRCRATPSTASQFCLLRLNANGSVDATFGASGVIFNMGTASSGVAHLQRQPDGKLLVGGQCYTGGIADICLARLHHDGQYDYSFGNSGRAVVSLVAGDDYLSRIALQPDGKAVVASACSNGSNYDFCVARFEGGPYLAQACSLDLDGDGSITATVDSLIHARIALGIRGEAVTNGILFGPGAARPSWGAIRGYLNQHCGMNLAS